MFYQIGSLLFAILMMPLAAGLAKSLGKRIGKAVGKLEVFRKFNNFLSEILEDQMIRIYQKEEENKNGGVVDDLVEKNIKLEAS